MIKLNLAFLNVVSCLVVVVVLATACAHQSGEYESGAAAGRAGAKPPQEEVSLKADRSELQEMRKDIPEETKRENDELASLLQILSGRDNSFNVEPSKARERFDKVMRDKRATQDKNIRTTREAYTKQEHQKSEEFIKKQKEQRENFAKGKHTPDERKSFFEELEQARRDFYSDQNEKRRDFESNMQAKRHDFDDYARERTSEFNELHRQYRVAYDERKKGESLKKSMEEKKRRLDRERSEKQGGVGSGASTGAAPSEVGAGSPQGMRGDPAASEFDKIPSGPGTPLGSEEK